MNILAPEKPVKKSMFYPGENHWVNIIIKLAKPFPEFTT